MEFEKLENCHGCGNKKKSQGWIWTVATLVTYILFMLVFLSNFLKMSLVL